MRAAGEAQCALGDGHSAGRHCRESGGVTMSNLPPVSLRAVWSQHLHPLRRVIVKPELLQSTRKNVLARRASSPWEKPNLPDRGQQGTALLIRKSQPKWKQHCSRERGKFSPALAPHSSGPWEGGAIHGY